MSPDPLVSVVMAVHNGERYLVDAVESILGQSFVDFEFIVIDDGSTDSTPDIIARYAREDMRFVPFRREKKGLTKSLNEAVRMARGKYIARHDADDIALSHRLSTTVEFLEANPSIAATGSWCETIDEEGASTGKIGNPVDPDQIAFAMAGYCAMIHPTMVIRRQAFADFGPYDEECSYAQDYELWTRWIRQGAKLTNVPEILVKYRRGAASQISRKHGIEQTNNAVQIASMYIDFLLSEPLPLKQVLGLRQLIGYSPIDSDAVGAVPALVRLLELPRFRSIASSSIRRRPAQRAVSAIGQFGAGNRKAALSGLLIAARLRTHVLLDRGWWTCLARLVLFDRVPMSGFGPR
jgi:glycosyltransferase involved in cell wall biosynthesis